MKIDPNNPHSFYLTEEENQKIFEFKIIPTLEKDFDLPKSKHPTVYLTAGLPGAGKSSLINKMKNEIGNDRVFVANSDEMRRYHPKYKEALLLYGSNAGQAIYKDSSIFSEKSIQYAIDKKVDFIIDGTMKEPDKAEKLLSFFQKQNYSIKVTMIAVNEYESLQGIFNRYAEQYKVNPITARFVDPKFVKPGMLGILDSAKIIDEKNIDEFKIIDRDHTVIFDSKIDNKSPVEIIKTATDIQNWSKPKIDKMQNIWQETIYKLQEVKTLDEIISMAKSINNEMDKTLKLINNTK